MRLALIGIVCWMVYAPSHATIVEIKLKNAAGVSVEDAAVILEPLTKSAPKKRARATVEQRDRELAPYLTVVQTGTAIDFPNRDPFKHHLYSFSEAKHFEIKLYAGQPMQPVVFDKPGEVALGCNIHDWMEAYIYVTDSPYFAKTDKHGYARFKNLPQDNYRLKIWHPRQKLPFASQAFVLKNTHIKREIIFEIFPRLVKSKPPLDLDQY